MLHPNPVKNTLFIRNTKKQSLSVKVINLEGRIVKSFITKSDQIEKVVNVDDIPKGFYLVKIYAEKDKNQETIKIYKE